MAPDTDNWEALANELASVRAAFGRAKASRVGSSILRTRARDLVKLYFRTVRPELQRLGFDDLSLEPIDQAMQRVLALANGHSAKRLYLKELSDIRRALGEIEPEREVRIGRQSPPPHQPPATAVVPSPVEQRILSALRRLVPSAALSYEQALIDLHAERRSYRGTANELREALREVLDELAPDEDVMAEKDYTPEDGRTTPTHKQRVRYILRSLNLPAKARKAPEYGVSIVEELTASLARSTYERTNIAAHVSSARREVSQLKMYIDVVLAELLEIHD